MSPEQIQMLAQEIVSSGFLLSWKFYVLQALLAVLAGACGAYGASYLQKRGETLATRADFEEILQQLKGTTQVAEDVRSKIQARSNERYGYRAVRREKLEQMVHEAFKMQDFLADASNDAYEGTVKTKNDPAARIAAIQALYFHDLRFITERLTSEGRREHIACMEVAWAVVRHRQGEVDHSAVVEAKEKLFDRHGVFDAAMDDFVEVVATHFRRLWPKEDGLGNPIEDDDV